MGDNGALIKGAFAQALNEERRRENSSACHVTRLLRVARVRSSARVHLCMNKCSASIERVLTACVTTARVIVYRCTNCNLRLSFIVIIISVVTTHLSIILVNVNHIGTSSVNGIGTVYLSLLFVLSLLQQRN